MKFEYSIDDRNKDAVDVQEDFNSARDPLEGERIRVTKDKGSTQIQANQEGWLYLAKVCIEMAYCAEKDPTFHVHRTEDFKFSDDESRDALGLFLLEES